MTDVEDGERRRRETLGKMDRRIDKSRSGLSWKGGGESWMGRTKRCFNSDRSRNVKRRKILFSEWWLTLVLTLLWGVKLASGKLVSGNETVLSGPGLGGGGVHLGAMQSQNFIPCHFNPLCFCKYDQKTEIYDTVRRLWQMVGFNQSNFFSAVQSLVHHMKHDTATTYHIAEGDLYNFASLLVNASLSPIPQSPAFLVEPGPVFDIDCSDVPMALIPTEYNSHGVIAHVSVSGSKLGMLDGSAFAGLEIQGIRLSRDQLYFINEYAFSSVSNSLIQLDISANYLDEVPFAAFKSLKLLEWLNLSNNLLNSVAGDWFSVPASLRKLLLAANSIDTLPHKLLPAFSRLHWLDLTSNFIRNLSQDNLPPNLQTLKVIKNRLTHFPSSVFHLDSLSWIFLGGNAIEEVPQDWPHGLPRKQLNQIDLSDNFINVWPTKAFGSQLSVLDMSVSKNQLTTLPDGAFWRMNIFRLSLGFNRIGMIDPRAFSSLESTLKYLNLENNRLRTIPWRALSNLTSLMHLYLGSNGIQDDGVSPPPDGVECKLTYLGLNGNQLTRIPKDLLMQCPHLYHVNLGYNQVGHLDDFLRLNPPSMGETVPGGGKLRRLKYLSTLILRNNPIRSLSYTYSAEQNSSPFGGSTFQTHATRRNAAGDHNLPTNPTTDTGGGEFHSREDDNGNGSPRIPEIPKQVTTSTTTINKTTHQQQRLRPSEEHLLHLGGEVDKDLLQTRDGPHQLASTTWTGGGPSGIHGRGKHGQQGFGGNFMNSHERVGRGRVEGGGAGKVGLGRTKNGLLYGDEDNDRYPEALALKSNGGSGVLESGGKKSGGSVGGTSIFRSEIFTNLHELSLSFCSLTGELEPFPSLPLTTLEISMGLKSATTLHSGLFNSLRNLEWLALDHNSLSTISSNTFYWNRKLSYVNLEWNRLGELPPQMFHPDIHGGMTQLRLSHNRIQTIQSESFLSFPAINLDLSYNQITTIERHAFFTPNGMWGEGGSSARKSASSSATHTKPAAAAAPAETINTQGEQQGMTFTQQNIRHKTPGKIMEASEPGGGTTSYGFSASASAFSKATLASSSSGNGAGGHNLNGAAPIVAAVEAVIGKTDEHPGLNVYLSHNRLTNLPSGAFAQEKFRMIDLSYNWMNTFNFDAFGRKTIIEGLNLSHNSLERINLKQRWAGNHIIKFLDLSHNRIPYRGVDFSSLCITVLLDLSNNKIEKVDSKIFPHNCSLKELRLGNNAISSIDSRTFEHLGELTVLDLSSNEITVLPPVVFIKNIQLRTLDLSNNRLRSLPRDCLIGSAIEVLNLGRNQFVNLPTGALSLISRRLRRLDISENSLEYLDSTMFESIRGLVHLNVSTNRLSILPDNAFENLASLRELDLSYNYLRATFKEVFHHLPKLKLLRLRGCGIQSLPFLPLQHLISLDMAHNGLKEMSMTNLGSLTRLRHLDLSYNELSSGDLPSWTPLYNLVTLRLSNNPLKSFTKDTFYGLAKLEHLEIVDISRPDRFDSDVFSHMNNLRSLAVETHPNIERYRFRLGAILSSVPQLEELRVVVKEETLSDQLNGIQPKLRKLTVTGEKLRRIESGALEGLQNCLHIDLAITHTSVDDIPLKIFEKLQGSLWARLDLSHNKLYSLDSFAFVPGHNRSLWYSRGTKILEGGLVLNGNEWVCDCDLVSLGDWLRRWLRESFQSHSTDNIPLVHAMYESLRGPVCKDSKGKTIPIIELYSDTMCHASALSSAHSSKVFTTSAEFNNQRLTILHYLSVHIPVLLLSLSMFLANLLVLEFSGVGSIF